jgi:hypothetical protein
VGEVNMVIKGDLIDSGGNGKILASKPLNFPHLSLLTQLSKTILKYEIKQLYASFRVFFFL